MPGGFDACLNEQLPNGGVRFAWRSDTGNVIHLLLSERVFNDFVTLAPVQTPPFAAAMP